MSNDVSIQRNSFKIIPSPSNPSMQTLSFTYEAVCEIIITVYFLVKEISDPVTDVTQSFASITQNTPQPVTIICQAGKNASFPLDTISMNLNNFPPEVLETKLEHHYGIVLRMERRQGPEKRVWYTYCEFVAKHEANGNGVASEPHQKYSIRVKRQKMELDGSAFEVNEIWGIDNSDLGGNKGATIDDTNKECSVCLSEKIDTIVMPCLHMCLCGACATELSKKPTGRKCPICRVNVETFVRLSYLGNTTGVPHNMGQSKAGLRV